MSISSPVSSSNYTQPQPGNYQNFNINNNGQGSPSIINTMEGSKVHVNMNITNININGQKIRNYKHNRDDKVRGIYLYRSFLS